MARRASGAEHVQAAYALLHRAKTAEEMRLAQAVLLPLELGLSLDQTAQAIGRSPVVTCAMRTRFVRVAEGRQPPPRRMRELRNRAHVDLAREAQILDEVLADSRREGVAAIPQIKGAIEIRLGRSLALSSVYRMLARHGWRKQPADPTLPKGRQVWCKLLHGARRPEHSAQAREGSAKSASR